MMKKRRRGPETIHSGENELATAYTAGTEIGKDEVGMMKDELL
jgi:hypothetical protein